MPKRSTNVSERRGPLKNVMVDKDAFESIMRRLIASPPIRKDDLTPKKRAQKKNRAKRSS